MMGKAGHYHIMRGFVGAAIVSVLAVASWEGLGRLEGRRLAHRVLVAITTDVSGLVKKMTSYRRWVNPLLREAYAQAERDTDRSKQLRASIALLPDDAGQVDYLVARLLEADAHEIVVIRDALLPYKAELSEPLWNILEDQQANLDRRFHAACGLAGFTPDEPRWEKVSSAMAAQLAIRNASDLGKWAEALQPAGKSLLEPLALFLADENRNGLERSGSVNLYKTFAEGRTNACTRLEKVLTEPCKAQAWDETKVAFVKRQANVGVSLLAMGRSEKVWPLLKQSPDPTLRSYMIDRLMPGGVDPNVLITRFDEEQDLSIKRALLLSLGACGLDRLPEVERQQILPKWVRLYRANPEPGIHSAAEWLLRRWEAEATLKDVDKELATGKVEGKRGWYINGQGQTMMVVPEPADWFWMGEKQERHKQRINRSFAIASKEMTVEQFRRFRESYQPDKDFAPRDDCPAIEVTWFDAPAYCNWLSEKDGLPKEEWCHVKNAKDEYGEGMKMAANYLRRKGYRLPTEAEWEYACRAGAGTRFSFGDPDDLLGNYAWHGGNSFSKGYRVALLRPNDYGFFDMHGNAAEWCQDRYTMINNEERADREDERDTISIQSNKSRLLRGGSFDDQASHVRSSYRNLSLPTDRNLYYGFRPARTVTP